MAAGRERKTGPEDRCGHSSDWGHQRGGGWVQSKCCLPPCWRGRRRDRAHTLRVAVPGERAGGGRLSATNSFSPHALGKSTQPCSQLRGRQSLPVASALGGGTCPLSYRKQDCRACPIGLAPAPPKAQHARTGSSGQAQEGHQLCASLLAPAGAGSFRTAHWQRIRALAANPVGERRREGAPALCHSGSQGAGL